MVARARAWLGTPYVHQASAKGRGADCLGLIIGLYTELYGAPPETPPPYTPDWNERRPCEEPLLSAARRRLVEAEGPAILPGRILIFRVVTTGPAKHCGIVSGEDRFIHAYAGRAVVESWLSRWWLERIAGAFDFFPPPPCAGVTAETASPSVIPGPAKPEPGIHRPRPTMDSGFDALASPRSDGGTMSPQPKKGISSWPS